MTVSKLKCWNCGAPLDDVPLPISRHATCSACFNELHCCRLCRHYEPQRTGAQCAEDRADPPVVKEGANFCDWFQPSASAFSKDTVGKQDSAQSKLDEIFGSGATEDSAKAPQKPQSQEDEARARLDALFAPKNKM
jgi:hypothetical protein